MCLDKYPDIRIFRGILQRVVDEVSDHLLHHALASENRRHHTGQALVIKADVLLIGLLRVFSAYLFDRLIDAIDGHIDLIFVILDLGKERQVRNDLRDPVSLFVDLKDIVKDLVRALFAKAPVDQGFRVSVDRSKRSFQFM